MARSFQSAGGWVEAQEEARSCQKVVDREVARSSRYNHQEGH